MNRSTGQVSYRSGTFWERTERVSSDGEQQRISRETVLLEEREREGGREGERERERIASGRGRLLNARNYC